MGSRQMTAVTLGVVLILGADVQAQIYKWVDEEGEVHFSDRPGDPGLASETETVDLELNYQPEERTPQEREALRQQWEAELVAGQQRREAEARARVQERQTRKELKMMQCQELDREIAYLGAATRIPGRLQNNFIEGEDGQSISEEAQRARVEELRRKRAALGCN